MTNVASKDASVSAGDWLIPAWTAAVAFLFVISIWRWADLRFLRRSSLGRRRSGWSRRRWESGSSFVEVSSAMVRYSHGRW